MTTITNTTAAADTAIKSWGRLRYSPTNNGKSVRRDGGTTKWWCVIDCDPAIGYYYRELYRMSFWGVHTLNRPAWDAHISIISNEKPPNEAFWKKYDGQTINFEYRHTPLQNDIYVWLPVICPFALDLREELGLNRNPFRPLHLTFGNRKEST